jgi:hypothetical protein
MNYLLFFLIFVSNLKANDINDELSSFSEDREGFAVSCRNLFKTNDINAMIALSNNRILQLDSIISHSENNDLIKMAKADYLQFVSMQFILGDSLKYSSKIAVESFNSFGPLSDIWGK